MKLWRKMTIVQLEIELEGYEEHINAMQDEIDAMEDDSSYDWDTFNEIFDLYEELTLHIRQRKEMES